MNSTKLKLRKVLKAERLAMTASDRAQKNQLIRNKLEGLVDWSVVGKVHCFEPIVSLGEVDVMDLFRDKIDIFTSRKVNSEWITVSLSGNNSPPKKFDLIIVPMLGFDDSLHRIGYGGGYYDKFLATQTHAQKIGVCFEICKVEEIPAEKHDVKLDFIITEKKIYS